MSRLSVLPLLPLLLAACVSAEAERDKQAKDFWSFFETGEMGAESAPASPYLSNEGESVPDLLAPDVDPRPTSGPGSDGDDGDSGQAEVVDPGSTDPAPFVPVPVNWYSEFGEKIMVRSQLDPDTGAETTWITKPYPMPLGRAQKLLDLMKFYGTFDMVIVDGGAPTPSQPPAPGSVEVTVLGGWDTENYGNLRGWPPAPMNSQAVGDRLVVTAEAELLYEVEDFVDLFMADVPQIEIEAKIIEVVETDELFVGIGPAGDNPIFGFPDKTFVDDFTYDFPSAATASEALLTVSGIHDGVSFNAVLDAVATLENVEVDSRPKIAVREGGVASIEATEDVPYYTFTGISSSSTNFNANLAYKEVGIKLYVSPRLVGTETLSLFVEVESSSEAGNVVTFVTDSGGSLSTPRISKQVARTTVYLEPGQAVIIAGLTTERSIDTERKVPLLGDIPLLGALFRNQGSSLVRTHTLFYIKPRILQGIDQSYVF